VSRDHTFTKSYLEAAPREGRGTDEPPAAATAGASTSTLPISVEAEAIARATQDEKLLLKLGRNTPIIEADA